MPDLKEQMHLKSNLKQNKGIDALKIKFKVEVKEFNCTNSFN